MGGFLFKFRVIKIKRPEYNAPRPKKGRKIESFFFPFIFYVYVLVMYIYIYNTTLLGYDRLLGKIVSKEDIISLLL